jgi:hypothetical protein
MGTITKWLIVTVLTTAKKHFLAIPFSNIGHWQKVGTFMGAVTERLFIAQATATP